MSTTSLGCPHPRSFPTRRSSDLATLRRSRAHQNRRRVRELGRSVRGTRQPPPGRHFQDRAAGVNAPAHPGKPDDPDRKSTRLNSSHLGISYAVFCLKKKKKTKIN